MHLDSRKGFLSGDIISLKDVFPFQSIPSPYHTTLFFTDSPLSADESDSPKVIPIDIVVSSGHVFAETLTVPILFTIDMLSNQEDDSQVITPDDSIPVSAHVLASKPTRTKKIPAKVVDYTNLPYQIPSQSKCHHAYTAFTKPY